MTAHDKHNHPIAEGDIVEVVYGGDHHTMVVESLSEEHGHHYLHGSVTVRVPATGASRRESENPAAAPREGTRVHVREEHKAEPKAEHKAEPKAEARTEPKAEHKPKK